MRQTRMLARELGVVGLINVQYAIFEGVVYILEVNPRASRTIPFVSKAIGVPLAKLAALVMAGKKLADLGFTAERVPEPRCRSRNRCFLSCASRASTPSWAPR